MFRVREVPKKKRLYIPYKAAALKKTTCRVTYTRTRTRTRVTCIPSRVHERIHARNRAETSLRKRSICFSPSVGPSVVGVLSEEATLTHARRRAAAGERNTQHGSHAHVSARCWTSEKSSTWLDGRRWDSPLQRFLRDKSDGRALALPSVRDPSANQTPWRIARWKSHARCAVETRLPSCLPLW